MECQLSLHLSVRMKIKDVRLVSSTNEPYSCSIREKKVLSIMLAKIKEQNTFQSNPLKYQYSFYSAHTVRSCFQSPNVGFGRKHCCHSWLHSFSLSSRSTHVDSWPARARRKFVHADKIKQKRFGQSLV